MWTDGRTDKRTDMMKLIVAFRNSGNAPKTNCSLWSYVDKN